MPPAAVIEPSYIWHKRAAIFSACFLALLLVGAYAVHPIVLILAPFVVYRAWHALRFMQPGRVGIEIYEDRLLCKPAFGKPREIRKQHVVRFVAVYRGTTEVVVARTKDVEVRGTQERQLIHPSDIVVPMGLMRNPGLVRKLEAWRQGTLFSQSLIPPQTKQT
jgi:hypothetical protein